MSTTVATPASPREDPAPRVSLWRIPRSRSLLFLILVGAVCGVLVVGARLYTDLLWYREVGQVDLFWTTLRWKILAGAAAGLGTASFLLLNLVAVERAMAPAAGSVDDRSVAAQLWKNRRLIQPAVAIAGGWLAVQLRAHDSWQLLLLWTHRSGFGVKDPLFHRDVGFFVFSLPLYQEVARWLLETGAMGAVATLGAYAAGGAFRSGQRRAVVRAARAHLLALAAALLVVVAWRFRIEQYALALPHDRVAPGATYSDESVRLPILRLVSVLALVGAGVCMFARVRPLRVVAVAVLGLVAVLALWANSDLPAAVDRFSVAPQVLARERPHVLDAIAYTRRAYGLDRVSVRELPAGAALTEADVAKQRRTVDNLPLWDPSVLRPAMNELQSIGAYYGFPSTSVGPYTVDGKPVVMTVGARQLDLQGLGRRHRSWANERFAYTHGYGIVAVRGGDADRGGAPRFAQQGFEAGANPLGVRQPRAYFGEQSGSKPPYVLLNTGRAEVDEPIAGDRAPSYRYDGGGGIAISSAVRRLAFATRFGDLDLLLSETVTNRSRILLHRNVRDRLHTLAPFLHWDARPQTAVIDGRVQFLFDGYTTSDSYPYSAEVRMGGEKVNYVQLAAHAAVDAFSGRVSIYAAASADPILRAWEAVYPGLFLPSSKTPQELLSQLRYPKQLFAAQAAVYETYHAQDPTAFWNGADAWARALQVAGPVEQAGEIRFPDPSARVDTGERGARRVVPGRWRMRPAYGLARLPGEARERFLLTTPFTPRGRENLVAYLAGSLDAHGRPELTALTLPRDRLMIGPTQVTRRILSTPGAARRLALLNRESRDLGRAAVSRTILGVPRIVPIADTLVYVQPLFLTSDGEGVPRLRLVTAYANGRVGYGRDLKAALRRVGAASR